MNNTDTRLWAIVPAAGVGKRVGGPVPKQYLDLNGRPLIEWTLDRLLELEELQQLMVVVSAEDEYWPELEISNNPRIQTAPGGSERCHSVLNGLESLADKATADDWVLVHDAARPCVRITDIRHLIDTAKAAQQGGILAMPVRDTIKQSNNIKKIQNTVDRSSLWHALTPQLFRYAELRQALHSAIDNNFQVTDEASAMEYAGQQPMLVEGASDNIKVTLPEDLALASFFITKQENT
ncbi:MAG: 2-C-methyl-D-erythritol 4-phosphate cytidylyltransferase [Gammaproteobacteria bacterium]|nr:2-C-methyl-D-erythritol 4-phosphate cytidylyltransferase [Gammaproteobacteria bacterium]